MGVGTGFVGWTIYRSVYLSVCLCPVDFVKMADWMCMLFGVAGRLGPRMSR